MANKYDLMSFYASNTANASHATHIGGLIPAGKTRFLTYIRIERATAVSLASLITGVTALIGSVAYSNATGVEVSAGVLMALHLQNVSNAVGSSIMGIEEASYRTQIPDRPDIDHPILAVAGGASNWMQLCVIGTGPGTTVFAQYYDE